MATRTKSNKTRIIIIAIISLILFLVSLSITIINYQNYVETGKQVEIAKKDLAKAREDYQRSLNQMNSLR